MVDNAPTIKKIEDLNLFLRKIVDALERKIKLTMGGGRMFAKGLSSFAQLYYELVYSTACDKDYEILVGMDKEWTLFLCKPRGRPMHILYKWLALLGVMSTGCWCFYLKDTANKNKKPILLTNQQTIDNFYNRNMLISERNSTRCFTTLQKKDLPNMIFAHNLISQALQLRNDFLGSKYCKSLTEDIEPDIQHEFFEKKLESIANGLSTRINEFG